MKNTFKVTLKLDEASAEVIAREQFLRVSSDNPSFPEVHMDVKTIQSGDSLLGTAAKEARGIFSFWSEVISNGIARQRLSSTLAAYILLASSPVASFFIRGWRLSLIRQMLEPDATSPIPPISDLWSIGESVKEGLKLIGVKFCYDAPKYLFLVAFSYDFIDAILDWCYYIFRVLFGSGATETVAEVASQTVTSFEISLSTSLIIYIVYSCLVTPAFKISEIKYAAGKMSFKGFFSPKELAHSFKLYRKYRFKTFSAYLYDNIVTVGSFFFALGVTINFLFVIIPFIVFVLPTIKLLLNHLPKYYGYGLLAQRMQVNGDLPAYPKGKQEEDSFLEEYL
jgi:hypothetical protein